MTTPLPPGSPRSPTRPSSLMPMESEMDVSRVDPEQALVDYQTVDVDLSGDVDESLLDFREYGKEDKVLVSVRYET